MTFLNGIKSYWQKIFHPSNRSLEIDLKVVEDQVSKEIYTVRQKIERLDQLDLQLVQLRNQIAKVKADLVDLPPVF